jgi:hypothetical protein
MLLYFRVNISLSGSFGLPERGETSRREFGSNPGFPVLDMCVPFFLILRILVQFRQHQRGMFIREGNMGFLFNLKSASWDD